MSIDLIIYVPATAQDLHERVLQELRAIFVECEFAAGFVFNQEEENTGFIPIRWKVNASDPVAEYRGMDISTGFEIYVSDFDYSEELAKVQQKELPSIFQKIFGKKLDQKTARRFIADERIDSVLAKCRKKILFVFHSTSGPSSLMLGNCIAAIVAMQSNGVVYDPQAAAFDSEEAEGKSYLQSREDLEGLIHGSLSMETDSAAEEPFEGW